MIPAGLFGAFIFPAREKAWRIVYSPGLRCAGPPSLRLGRKEGLQKNVIARRNDEAIANHDVLSVKIAIATLRSQ
jgi:hypothetical protein